MGIVASLFFTNDSEKQTLHRRIIPTDEQRESQQKRWNDLAEYLKEQLKENSAYPIYSWLQGSYKFATQLRPLMQNEEFDIDLGIYFQWSGQPDDGNFTPLQLKRMVQEKLEQYAKEQSDIKKVALPKMRCNRIHYGENFHIDVPVYHLDSSRDARALATQNDDWENSDPKLIYLWFKKQVPEETRSQVRRLIRYLKAWAILNIKEGEGRPSAILLTVLVAESYGRLSNSETASEDEALAGILKLILARLKKNQKVRNPVNTKEVLSERLGEQGFLEFIDHLQKFGDLATRAVAANTEVEAAALWINVYKHFFPLPESEVQMFCHSKQDSKILPAFTPNVFVKAEREKHIYKKTNQWFGYNQISSVPKNCSITFTLVNNDKLPPGATVEWIVRNEGYEAEKTNDLGHEAGIGSTVKESSAYKGCHYMDCIVRQHGHIISMRRIPVRIV
jgi:hypothetical protein